MKICTITANFNPYFKQNNSQKKFFPDSNNVHRDVNQYDAIYSNPICDEFKQETRKSGIMALPSALNVLDSSNTFDEFEEYDKTVAKINDSLSILGKLFSETTKVKDLDSNSRVFEIIKKDYPEFDAWLKKVGDRTVYTFKSSETGELVGMLIPKLESQEEIDCVPKIESDRVMKLCSMVIDPEYRRATCGLLLMFQVLDYAAENNVKDIYFTRYPKEHDIVIKFFEQFGFKEYGKNSNGEIVYVRHIDEDSDGLRYDSIFKYTKPRLSDKVIEKLMRLYGSSM